MQQGNQSVLVSSDNCEKELTLFDIVGNFSRNFDIGSGMDPFLEVTFAKQTLSTEVQKNAGKDPEWKATMKFNFLFDNQLIFNAYDEDPDRNEQIGSGVVSIADLKGGKGTAKLALKGVAIGEISFKYDIKKLPNRRNFQLENIRMELFQGTSLDSPQCTLLAVLDDQEFRLNPTTLRDTVAVWDDYLRLKLPDMQKDVKLRVLFGSRIVAEEWCFLEEYEYAEGTKEHYLVDQDTLEPFALLSYGYRSVNVSPPSNSFIKSDIVDLITIDGMKVEGGKWARCDNICLRVLIGRNFLDAQKPKDSANGLQFNNGISLYKESREKKLTFLLLESKLTRNKLLGRCDLLIKGLQNEKQRKQLLSTTMAISFNFKKQSISASTVILSQFELKMPSRNSQLHPYVFVKLGESSFARTQAVELGKKPSFQFRRLLTFTFSNEQELEFRVYDEDASTYELIGSGRIGIQELRGELGDTIPNIQLRGNDGRDVGTLTFEHTLRLSNTYLKMLFGEIGLLEQPAVVQPQQPARKSIPSNLVSNVEGDRPANEPARAKSLKFKQLVRKN